MDRQVRHPGPTRPYGFRPASELTDSIPTSEVLLADLTHRWHVFLLHRDFSLANPLGPPLIDLDFPDEHPEPWHQSVQDEGLLCLAVGSKTPGSYADVAHLLADCELLQVGLAVRGNEHGVTTRPSA